MPPVERPAIAISGGTARGAYAAGFLRRLCQRCPAVRGARIVSGTSTGALMAPLLTLWIAEPERGDEVLERMLALYAVDSAQVFRSEPRSMWLRLLLEVASILALPVDRLRAGAMLVETGAILDTSPLRAIIERELSDDMAARLARAADRVECIVNCVSAQQGDLVTFSTRDARVTPAILRDAVYASCLQPLFMPLHRIGAPGQPPGMGEEHMDGGVRDIVPAWAAIEAGATRLFAIALTPDGTSRGLYDPGRFGGRDRLPELFERVVVDMLDGEVADDDVLEARYMATIGRLVAAARASGMDEAALESATELLLPAERAPFEGRVLFRDLLVHRPAHDAPLEETFTWTRDGMRRSIEAGMAAADGPEGDRACRFFEEPDARSEGHPGPERAQGRRAAPI